MNEKNNIAPINEELNVVKYETENINRDLILYPTGANLVGYFAVLYIININYLPIPYVYSTFAKKFKRYEIDYIKQN